MTAHIDGEVGRSVDGDGAFGRETGTVTQASTTPHDVGGLGGVPKVPVEDRADVV